MTRDTALAAANGRTRTRTSVLVAVALIVLGLAGVVARSALAQESSPSLALLLARVAVNEDSRPLRAVRDGGTAGELTADTKAIWQVALDWSRWKRTTPLHAIRALAPHVTGTRAPKLARHALYGSLTAFGHARPVLWLDAEHGPWAAYGRNWARFRDNVARLVSGGAARPCPAAMVVAWGNDADTEIALARGLVEVDCGDTRNRFWSLPAERVLSATVARGGR